MENNILSKNKINDKSRFNNLYFFNNNNVYRKSNSLDENNRGLFNFEDFQKLIEIPIKHIMVMKPFYSKSKSIPLKKIEFDYFKKEIEKSGKNLYELFDGCLDCINDIV